MQNFLIFREKQTEFLKFKIHFAKISYKEFLIKKMIFAKTQVKDLKIPIAITVLVTANDF